MVGCIPVNFTSKFGWSLLGHCTKLLVTLPPLLAQRGRVELRCEKQILLCSGKKILSWLFSPDSNRVAIILLFIATMAGDLCWRRPPDLNEYTGESEDTALQP